MSKSVARSRAMLTDRASAQRAVLVRQAIAPVSSLGLQSGNQRGDAGHVSTCGVNDLSDGLFGCLARCRVTAQISREILPAVLTDMKPLAWRLRTVMPAEILTDMPRV